jgi:hypothetical protein
VVCDVDDDDEVEEVEDVYVVILMLVRPSSLAGSYSSVPISFNILHTSTLLLLVTW